MPYTYQIIVYRTDERGQYTLSAIETNHWTWIEGAMQVLDTFEEVYSVVEYTPAGEQVILKEKGR